MCLGHRGGEKIGNWNSIHFFILGVACSGYSLLVSSGMNVLYNLGHFWKLNGMLTVIMPGKWA